MSQHSTQHALVLSPHPDDESLGCGGTLRLVTGSGGTVDVLFMTRGENGHYPGVTADAEACRKLGEQRAAEAAEACRILGVRQVIFADGADGVVARQPQLAERIGALLRQGGYRSVFCPWPYDGHGDHAATYLWLHHALAGGVPNLDVWLYEVWTPLPPNIHIAIDPAIEIKLEAARAHRSQVSMLNYAEAYRGLAAFRSLRCPPARYAEAFFTCESIALLRHEGIPWPRPAELSNVTR